MKISEIISALEMLAPPALQEDYDNAGLLTGEPEQECTGVLCTLDATEEVIREAAAGKLNLVVTHHPINFRGLKRINGRNYVERAVIAAIRSDVAIYAIHTNLDNVIDGVSGRMAQLLGLESCEVLVPRPQQLRKLFTFVPGEHAEAVRAALFAAGAGFIGNYSECSFNAEGYGTFRAGAGTDPFVGEPGKQHREQETRIELIFPAHAEKAVVAALRAAHPYEEPAFDIVRLENSYGRTGSGVIGELPEAVDPLQMLQRLKQIFRVPLIRHTRLPDRKLKRIAVCGGAGSFLISKALAAGADLYVTADIKYHEFFDGESKMLIADIGHYESEQFTMDLLREVLEQKFPNFAVLKTETNTNPVLYF